MIERRPLLGFLWPRAEPGPVDHEARQERWVRIPQRGPWRIAFLIAFSLTWLSLLPAAVISLVVAPTFFAFALVVAVFLPTGALLLRGWAAGTYVCDRGVKVSRVLSTTFIPWGDVSAVRIDESPRGWLGTPLALPSRSLMLDSPEESVPTTISTVGADLWLRPQAWDACSDRLALWWRETRG